MQNNTPLVSIIIPVYNGANFMRNAIDSALSQTYPNIEIIVINDGSTDNGKTDKIAKSYGNKIRYFKKTNGGVSSAINLGIKNMKGEYYSWLSHDDMYLPNKVQAEIDFLKQKHLLHKKVIVYSDYLLINKHGKTISEIIINHKLVKEKPIYAIMRGVLNGNSILIPKKAWDEYGGLNTNLMCTQDYAKWYEMNQTYQLIHIPKTLIKSRYHAKQATNTNPKVRAEGNRFWTHIIKAVSEENQKKLNGSSYAYYYYLIEFLKNTPYDEALNYCKKQIKKYPPEKLPPEEYAKYRDDIGPFSKNFIVKFFQLINREGLINTSKRIYKKLFKK